MRGPYTQFTAGNSGSRLIQENKRWYRTNIGQKVRTPLPYLLTRGSVTGGPVAGLFPHQLITGGSNVQGHPIAALTENRAGMPVDLTYTYNIAVRKWYDKARLTIQGGVDFAERGQTLRTMNSILRALRNPLKFFARATNGLKKENLRDTALKDIPGAYLAFHFGVEPLIKELYTLMEMLQKGRSKKRLVVANHKLRHFSSSNNAPGSGGYNTKSSYKAVVRISGVIEETNSNLADLDAIGLINPFDIAWELVPYSFVVDWFYPINVYLNTMFGIPGYSLTNAYRTDFVLATHSFAVNARYDPYFNQSYSSVSVKVDRTLLSLIYPSTQKTLNKWSTSITRALTSVALLFQILHRQR